MDENFFTTRTIVGRIVFSSSLEAWHGYKGLVVPGLEAGFKRQSIRFGVSENGLEAEYQVVDRQVHTSAPFPGTKLTGYHTESTGNNGTTFFSELYVRLEGPPAAKKLDLMQRCIQIVENRIALLGKLRSKDKIFLEQAALIDHIGEANVVEVRVRVQQFPTGEPVTFLDTLLSGEWGRPLELPELFVDGNPQVGTAYNPSQSWPPALWGYDSHGGVRNPAAYLFLLHCYLQTPCDPFHEVYNVAQGQSGGSIGESGTSYAVDVAAFVGPLPPADMSVYTEEHKSAIYTLTRAASRYTLRNLRTQMPFARKASISGTNDDTCIVFTLGKPVAQREIEVLVERIGQPPQIPKPLDTYTDGAIKGVLLEHHIRQPANRPTPDGKGVIFGQYAYYLYALNRPPREDEKLRIGILPVVTYSQDFNSFDPQLSYSEALGP